MLLFAQEKKWIEKVKQGNQQAYKKLYDAYAGYALRTAYGMTNSNQHASDIVQETFIKVYRNIDKFNLKKPFKPWFYQILLNESKRYMKKQNKQAIAVKSEELLDYANEQSSQANKNINLSEELKELKDIHREVLVLKYISGFKEREIATLLDLNVNTVKSRLFQARKQLKFILGGEYDEK